MTNNKAYILLLLAPIFWAGNYIMGKILSDNIEAISLVFIRTLIATIILMPLAYKQIKIHFKDIMNNKILIIGLGFFGTYMFQVALYKSVSSTPVLNASLMIAFCPTLVAIISHILKIKPLNIQTVFYCLLSAFGIIIILTNGNILLLLELEFDRGNLWGLLSVIIWAVYSILIVRLPKQIPIITSISLQMLVGLFFAFFTMYIFESEELASVKITYDFILPVIYIVLFPSILSLYCYNKGAKQVGGLIASGFVNLIPLFAVIMGILFLGEQLQLYHIISGILLFVSLYKITKV